MKRVGIFVVVAVSILVIGLIATFVGVPIMLNAATKQEPFYVGVTYCGSSTAEAKLLVDRVKSYTNLFVLQSGPLMDDEAAVLEIGDYAISCGLCFAPMFESQFASGTLYSLKDASWVGVAEDRWGDMFAGVYYGDEPGGKMLETYVYFYENENNGTGGNTTSGVGRSFIKRSDGGVTVGGLMMEDGIAQYFPNGSVEVEKLNGEKLNRITYYPNGSITLSEIDDLFTMENGSDRISQVESYESVLSRNPIPNCDAAAEIFAGRNQMLIDGLTSQWQIGNRSFPIFTSDYSLYWWDYQGGYDLVLAQLGWNNSVTQEISLARGAADLQGKRWGTIITWTYDQSPYLTSGNEMFEQMRMSYESGAEYVVIFNYARDMEGPYGTLKDEHFEALERFWKDVVQNLLVGHGGIKAEAAFVFPKNYGWGLRRVEDSVWGLWNPTEEAQQAWPRLQDAVAKHGLKLDIVFEDPAYPFAGKYGQVYYWNQTS